MASLGKPGEDAKGNTAARVAPDIRSALGRGGGAGMPGGFRDGRGGITGEPIPLDSEDPDYRDYLERIKRMIVAKWGFPCVKDPVTRMCEHKTAKLIVDFGILKNGRLQFVEIIDASGLLIYDEYAVNAIKLAAPFPNVPNAMMRAVSRDSTGVPIRATFSYVVETSIRSVLH